MSVRIFSLTLFVLMSSMSFAKNMAHVHLKHVYDAWHTTPNHAGFLEVVNTDALAFQNEIQLAMANSDIGQSKRHLANALMLLKGDPSKKESHFGLIPANEGVWKHTMLATQSIGATRDFRAKGDQIAELARSCDEQLASLLTLTEQSMTKTTTSDFADAMEEIKKMSDSMFASDNSTYAEINQIVLELRQQEGLL